MSTAVLLRAAAEQHYTITAAIAFGWCSMEWLVHLINDCKLARHFRWGHLTYFGARYFGLLTTISFLTLACVGHRGRLTCQGLYLVAHIASSLLFLSSGAMFWIRAGFICEWKKFIMIPLAIYGIIIAALAMKSSFGDYIPNLDSTMSSTRQHPQEIVISFVCSIESSTSSKDQAILRFMMASFDIFTAIITFVFLYRRETPHTWLQALLIRDQLIYVCATTLVYIALGMDLIFNKVVYLGVLCPSIISIISCRLFLRLKREGSEDHHVRASNLLSLSQQQQNQLSLQEDQIVVENTSSSPWYNNQSPACQMMPPSAAATCYPFFQGNKSSPDNLERSRSPRQMSIEETNDDITKDVDQDLKKSQDSR